MVLELVKHDVHRSQQDGVRHWYCATQEKPYCQWGDVQLHGSGIPAPELGDYPLENRLPDWNGTQDSTVAPPLLLDLYATERSALGHEA